MFLFLGFFSHFIEVTPQIFLFHIGSLDNSRLYICIFEYIFIVASHLANTSGYMRFLIQSYFLSRL